MILDEIAYHIDSNSTAFTGGTNLFKSFMPDTPDTATAVYEYSGIEPAQVFGSSTPAYENPNIQIVCRSTDYTTARSKAEFIYKLFNGVANQTLKPSSGATGTRYLRVMPLQSPFSIGQDVNARHQVVCNFSIMKSLST